MFRNSYPTRSWQRQLDDNFTSLDDIWSAQDGCPFYRSVISRNRFKNSFCVIRFDNRRTRMQRLPADRLAAEDEKRIPPWLISLLAKQRHVITAAQLWVWFQRSPHHLDRQPQNRSGVVTSVRHQPAAHVTDAASSCVQDTRLWQRPHCVPFAFDSSISCVWFDLCHISLVQLQTYCKLYTRLTFCILVPVHVFQNIQVLSLTDLPFWLISFKDLVTWA